jgi:L-malate glycosyltransferase
MKILIFSHEFPPNIGGAGVVAEQNAVILTKQGHSVTVLTHKGRRGRKNSIYKINEIYVLPGFWFLSYWRSVDFDNFDLIFINDMAATYTAGLVFSGAQLNKSIIFLHGSEPENIFIRNKFSANLIRFKHCYIKALKGCLKIVAVSEFMRDKFISLSGMKELSVKIKIKYSGLNFNIFYPNIDNSFRRGFGIKNSDTILLSVSRIVKDKGYIEKISIFNEICKERDDLYWIIVGSGKFLKNLKLLAKGYSLQKKIIFVGGVDRNKLSIYYSNSDVFWLLSNFKESFGLVYLESQACGTPVIANNHSGVIEAIKDGETGYLVNGRDEVLNILRNNSYKNINRKEVVEYARGFNLLSDIDDFI